MKCIIKWQCDRQWATLKAGWLRMRARAFLVGKCRDWRLTSIGDVRLYYCDALFYLAFIYSLRYCDDSTLHED